MPKYQTKQREILLDYLETILGEHFTAGDICDATLRLQMRS